MLHHDDKPDDHHGDARLVQDEIEHIWETLHNHHDEHNHNNYNHDNHIHIHIHHNDNHINTQLVKDEIDDIRESLDRLEAESQRRKNKLLEQVDKTIITIMIKMMIMIITMDTMIITIVILMVMTEEEEILLVEQGFPILLLLWKWKYFTFFHGLFFPLFLFNFFFTFYKCDK